MRVTLLPAAGTSSRMRGGDKLLELVDGEPILAMLAKRACAVSDVVICTLPSPEHARTRALNGLDVVKSYVPNAQDGMSVSLKAGVRTLPKDATGLMILPADMPDISSTDMRAAWEHFEATGCAALQCTTKDGARGHPIVFAPQLFAEFATLKGDRGAFKLLNALGDKVALFALAGERARLDLDTPEDWAAWRASRVER